MINDWIYLACFYLNYKRHKVHGGGKKFIFQIYEKKNS